MAVGYIYGTLLVATGKVRHVNIVYALGLVVNVILNLIFIPRFGAMGAAVTTVITQTVVLFGQILVVYRELNIVPLWRDVSKLLLYFTFSYIGFYFIKSVFEGHWAFSVIICLFICLLLSFILKVVSFKELTSLVTKKL
jgi:O-antigen/teichoic acid export membrane protein